jgi:hypothetical protein
LSGYPKSCDDVKKDLEERRTLFSQDFELKSIGDNVILHRLVREIDPQTLKPPSSEFTNYGLSVLVESSNYPLDICGLVEKDARFIGAVALDPQELEAMGYEICLDPYPDPLGNPQHPNHAQVVCKKTQGNAKKIRNNCTWSVNPNC